MSNEFRNPAKPINPLKIEKKNKTSNTNKTKNISSSSSSSSSSNNNNNNNNDSMITKSGFGEISAAQQFMEIVETIKINSKNDDGNYKSIKYNKYFLSMILDRNILFKFLKKNGVVDPEDYSYEQIITDLSNIMSKSKHTFHECPKEWSEWLCNIHSTVPEKSLLLQAASNTQSSIRKRDKACWDASLMKIIQIIYTLSINNHNELCLILGVHVILEELKKCYKNISKLKIYEEAWNGKVCMIETIMYEIMFCILSDSAWYHTKILNWHIDCGYHATRCARDTITQDTLYLCLHSPEYISNVVTPYLSNLCQKRTWFFSKSKTRGWKTLHFYDVYCGDHDINYIDNAFVKSLKFLFKSCEFTEDIERIQGRIGSLERLIDFRQYFPKLKYGGRKSKRLANFQISNKSKKQKTKKK